jgi:hypothetical protein
MDEKLGCEIATYIYMEEHCLDIRIPKLFAFGFTDGRQVRSPVPPLTSTLLIFFSSFTRTKCPCTLVFGGISDDK